MTSLMALAVAAAAASDDRMAVASSSWPTAADYFLSLSTSFEVPFERTCCLSWVVLYWHSL
jgi:hypothetical protein